MIRKFFLLGTFLLLLGMYIPTAQAYSEDWEAMKQETHLGGRMEYPVDEVTLTSAFGWRIHPISGQEKYHSGVDLGVDYGAPVRAAAAGKVIYSGWISGYGNTVIIDHGQGVTTLYGHNQALLVSVGSIVSQGQQIAEAGSTGNSTGPHCHFEVRVDDQPQDPGLYIDGLEDLEIRQFGELEGSGGSPHGTDFDDSNTSFEVSTDFGKPIKETIDSFTDALIKGISLIQGQVYWVFILLVTMDLALSAAFKGISEKEDMPFHHWLIAKGVLYAICLFLLMNWGNIVGNFALSSFPQLGSLAAGASPEEAGAILSNPTQIVQKGLSIVTPLINEALKVRDFWDLFTQGITALLCGLFGMLLLVCFCIIGIRITLAYLSFYFTILFSFPGFMFSGFSKTRKYANNGLNGVFAASLELMFFCIFSVMLQFTMSSLTVGALVETQISETQMGPADKIHGLEEALARIKAVESGGDYEIYNSEGSGAYGAYQQMPEFWDGRCEAYIAAGGTLCTASEDSPANAPDSYYSWCPENQDKVSQFLLEGFYEEYGSWDEAVRCWVGGSGMRHSRDADIYYEKLLNAKGAATVSRVVNISLLFQLLLLCLIFIFFGDHMAKLIHKQFGGMGFKLTNEQGN